MGAVTCRCDDDGDENVCQACENPLGPYNTTGYCNACYAELLEERRRIEDERAWHNLLNGKKP